MTLRLLVPPSVNAAYANIPGVGRIASKRLKALIATDGQWSALSQHQLGNGGPVMQQGKAILQYLLAGNTITSLEALKLFGCLRLSGRIYDLKKAGYQIDMELIDAGNGKHVASYRMAQKGQLHLAI